MHSFLESLADKILAIDSNPENHLVILPTKRSINFFGKILSSRIGTPTWLPEIYTLNEWASAISGLDQTETLISSFTLYDSYQKTLGAEAQSVSEFLSWSSALLNDFNDVSAYQIDPEVLFRELVDYTEIDQFSFLNSPLSEKQESYRRFWQKLPLIYENFTSQLLKKGLGTSGMVMSVAAQKCEEYFIANETKCFTVAGFNALTVSEKQLLKKMMTSGKGQVFFDAENYLLSPTKNAGLFINKNLREGLGEVLESNQKLSKDKPRVKIVRANYKLDQANAVAQLIKEIPEEELENTGLVLADESMLVPIIERLPSEVNNVNVTMGLNVGQSAFADWINSWLDLIAPFLSETESGKISSQKIQEFWNLPFSSALNLTPIDFKGSRFLDLNEFEALDSTPKISLAKGDSINLLNVLKSGLDWTKKKIESTNRSLPRIRMGFIGVEKLLEALNRLESFRESGQLNSSAIKQIFSRILNSTTLSLIGEPMKGLQIMGVLETRALGFENLILCSVDEGNLPKKSRIESFIPFEIRMFHNLPGRREKEAVYAYQFYRLLSHAENCTAIYNSDKGALGGGGISRYLLQVEEDLEGTDRLLKAHTNSIRIAYTPEPLKIVKDDGVISIILDSFKKRGLSASSINRYFDSPHEWFYTNVLKLRESESSEIDQATFGTIVHEAIEKLFEPYEGEIISSQHLKLINDNVDAELRRAFDQNAGRRDINTGVERLQFETGLRMIEAYLKKEKNEVENGTEIHFIGSEERIEKTLEVETAFGAIELKIKGFIDRIERRNGVVHLIDFKTGKVENPDLELSVKGDFEKNIDGLTKKLKTKGKALQLLLYHWLMRDRFKNETIKSQIISLPAPSKRDLFLKTSNHEATLEQFELFLKSTAEEMLSSDIDLEASEKYKFAVFA
ncbi:MAG: PD-(D/E)XK nuclease family protein [Bacteroidota bacterium]